MSMYLLLYVLIYVKFWNHYVKLVIYAIRQLESQILAKLDTVLPL